MDVPRPRGRRRLHYALYGVVALVGLVGITLWLRGLGVAAPTVERSTVWTDRVRRGPMLRDVLGQGRLVPEQIRWITAKTNARIDRILVKAGEAVRTDSVIVELGNTDLQLEAMEAERQLSQARAELVNLRATLEAGKLAQRSAIASLASELGEARRRAQADEELARRGFLSELERAQTHDRAIDLEGRLKFERQRLVAQTQGTAAQVAAQEAELARLESIVAFRKNEVAELHVVASIDGVIQELPLQPGQTVAAGALLAKVVRPDQLKAQLKIPETRANEVLLGLKASIDTRNGIVSGRVSRIDPAATEGTVAVDVTLEGPLPSGARPDLTIEGTIELERLADILFVGRPAFGEPGTSVSFFKLEPDGTAAHRTRVTLGRGSAKTIEVVDGLREGDEVILSDMSQWDKVDRVRLR